MKLNTDSKRVNEVLTRRVDQVLPSKEGLKKLMQKRKIRLYLGIDPTGTKLHLGHTITLRKLQEFAVLGHESILVVGTGTVLAGDPSARDKARPRITQKEIEKNIRTWKKQAGKILDFSKVKIRYNGDWLVPLSLGGILDIASHISAVKLFQRDMFRRRLKAGDTVWMHETLYPLLQGYDSVALQTDLEIGGTDQVFNMLIGRELMDKMLGKEKFVLTCPMVLGIDGKTMSKSSGNCVWIEDSPGQMFGKLMSIPDSLIIPYLELMTDLPSRDIQRYKEELHSKKVNPRDIKEKLAVEIVKTFHSLAIAQKSREEFRNVFREKKLPSSVPGINIRKKEISLLDLLTETGLVSSRSEAKRVVLQGGVKIDGKTQKDWRQNIEIKKEMILQIGKRKFAKIKPPA